MRAPVELEIAQQLPPLGSSLQEATRYTRWLATHHYENFTIATILLPGSLRQHFYNVYAYCRWADDLGDEIPETSRALELLDWWQNELEQCFKGRATHPVFIALRETVTHFDIPMNPFADLLRAFRQDQIVHQYETWDSLMDYCRYSANPVGHLVLYLCGYRDPERFALSDFTCTALQLANFWQDVARDLDKGRIYIPLDLLERFDLTPSDLSVRRFDQRYADLMRHLVVETRELFRRGSPLAKLLDRRFRLDIELFSRGGVAVLDAIESIGYNTLEKRPSLGKATKIRLVGSALASRVCSMLDY